MTACTPPKPTCYTGNNEMDSSIETYLNNFRRHTHGWISEFVLKRALTKCSVPLFISKHSLASHFEQFCAASSIFRWGCLFYVLTPENYPPYARIWFFQSCIIQVCILWFYYFQRWNYRHSVYFSLLYAENDPKLMLDHTYVWTYLSLEPHTTYARKFFWKNRGAYHGGRWADLF